MAGNTSEVLGLQDGIENYFSVSEVDYTCSICKTTQIAQQSRKIKSAGKVQKFIHTIYMFAWYKTNNNNNKLI